METPLYTFEAVHDSNHLSFLIALLFAIIALGGLIALLRRKVARENHNRNMLLALLTFFVFLIAASTAFFSWLAAKKIGTVAIYPDAIETSYGRAAFEHIRNAGFKDDKQPSLINPNISRKTTKLLIIEESDGKTHVLSEENYEIPKIWNKLKEAMEKWEDSPAN